MRWSAGVMSLQREEKLLEWQSGKEFIRQKGEDYKGDNNYHTHKLRNQLQPLHAASTDRLRRCTATLTYPLYLSSDTHYFTFVSANLSDKLMLIFCCWPTYAYVVARASESTCTGLIHMNNNHMNITTNHMKKAKRCVLQNQTVKFWKLACLGGIHPFLGGIYPLLEVKNCYISTTIPKLEKKGDALHTKALER